MGYSKVEGKNVVLTVSKTGDSFGVYCGQSVAINFEVEQLPSTSIQGGSFKEFQPGFITWDVTLSGLVFVKDESDPSWTVFDFTDTNNLGAVLTTSLTFQSESGREEGYVGKANIASANISGAVGTLSKFNVKFQGSGPLGRTIVDGGTIPSNNNMYKDIQPYFYTASADGETTIPLVDWVGWDMLDVVKEIQPLKDTEYSWDKSSGVLTLNSPLSMAKNETLFFHFTKIIIT